MKYVDWVERVLRATVEAFDAGNGFSTDEEEIAAQLGHDRDGVGERSGSRSPVLGGLGFAAPDED